jgi:molecular chaperone GrpE
MKDETDRLEPFAEDLAAGDASRRDAQAPGDELQDLEEERRRYEDLWLRARAELDNYRKRVTREQEDRERRAAERLLAGIVPIQDLLDHALASGREDAAAGADGEARFAAFYRGIELIRGQIAALLAKEGVTPIETSDIPFDPRLHEAAMRVEGSGQDSDTVVEVVQKGYLLGDRLLRPARVTVAK